MHSAGVPCTMGPIHESSAPLHLILLLKLLQLLPASQPHSMAEPSAVRLESQDAAAHFMACPALRACGSC